jgi:hypothetical protein
LNKKHQYPALHFAAPAIDNSAISFDLPERFPIQLAWVFSFEAVTVAA